MTRPRRPDNKLLAHPLEHKAVAPRHFWIAEKLGFAPVLRCWCGAALVLDYFTAPFMRRTVDAFCEQHEECTPPLADTGEHADA